MFTQSIKLSIIAICLSIIKVSFAPSCSGESFLRDSLERYEIVDSTFLSQVYMLSDNTPCPLSEKRTAFVLGYDRQGKYQMRNVQNSEKDAVFKTEERFGEIIYGWARYRGSVLLLKGQKIPWVAPVNEESECYAIFDDIIFESTSISLSFHLQDDWVCLDQYFMYPYEEICDTALSLDVSEWINGSQLYTAKPYYELSLARFSWKDPSIIKRMEIISSDTSYPILRSCNEKRIYTLRVMPGIRNGEWLFCLVDWGECCLTNWEYKYLRDMKDLTGVIWNDHTCFLLRGDIPSQFLNYDNQIKLTFKTITVEEQLNRVTDNVSLDDCDVLLFSYDGERLLLVTLFAEC